MFMNTRIYKALEYHHIESEGGFYDDPNSSATYRGFQSDLYGNDHNYIDANHRELTEKAVEGANLDKCESDAAIVAGPTRFECQERLL